MTLNERMSNHRVTRKSCSILAESWGLGLGLQHMDLGEHHSAHNTKQYMSGIFFNKDPLIPKSKNMTGLYMVNALN